MLYCMNVDALQVRKREKERKGIKEELLKEKDNVKKKRLRATERRRNGEKERKELQRKREINGRKIKTGSNKVSYRKRKIMRQSDRKTKKVSHGATQKERK